jgi:hypothetical protein
MTKAVTGRPRALLLASACFQALISLFAAPSPAQAQVNLDQAAACMHEGILAKKLALARDNGMTMLAAVDAVLAEDRSARREQVAAHAALLFERFRRMPAEQAAFEFRLACMDDAQ